MTMCFSNFYRSILPIFWACVLVNFSWAAETRPTYHIEPTPTWTKAYSPDLGIKADEDSAGVFYLLVDRQENLSLTASYYHEARRITSETGLQNGASLNVSFDPSYQKLAFHGMRVIRNEIVQERLEGSQITVMQRERDLESFLYDGNFSAVCQLEDVRVGDVIEYAYTITGANPVMGGNYFDYVSTEWSTPIHHALFRIIHPQDRKLHFSQKNRKVELSSETRNGETEWLWDEKSIAAKQVDANTPRGYNPYGSIEISEFSTWAQLANWALPLYQVATSSPELITQIQKLREIPAGEPRILAALRFVQEEVRYLGIEIGVGSHKPTAPQEVLRRRFGDCKDKTLLLATLLRELGFSATPALVNTYRGRSVIESLPSPGVFNHIILNVEYGNNTWWLDATRTSQRGPLYQNYIGDYGYALLIKEGETAPVAFSPPPASLSQRKVCENYKIEKPDTTSTLEVTSEYRGSSAESTRSFFKSESRENLQKKYLAYYAIRHPSIKVAKPLVFEELPGGMGCRVTEKYEIPSIWTLAENKSEYSLSIFPGDIDNAMGVTGSDNRNDPLALPSPSLLNQEICAEMFMDWSMTPISMDVKNDFFNYKDSRRCNGSRITLSYIHENLVDRVPVTGMATYGTALRKIKDGLGYTLTYKNPEQLRLASSEPSQKLGFNWPLAVVYGIFSLLLVTAAIWYFCTSRLHSKLPQSIYHQHLAGIGGWLTLVALGMVLAPFRFLVTIVQLCPTLFQVESWDILTVPGQAAYDPLWMPVLYLELYANTLLLIFSVMLAALFFKKRSVWPRCWALYLALFIIVAIADEVLVSQIPAAADALKESADTMARALINGAIWIPYAFLSKRVKATFRS